VAYKIQWTTPRGRDNRHTAAEGFLDHLAERLRRAGMYQNVKAGDDARKVLVTTSTEEPRTRHGPGKRCLPRTVADDHQAHARDASQGFEQLHALLGSKPTDVTDEQTVPIATGQHAAQHPVAPPGMKQVGIHPT
jgi:hypothetical protein